MNRFTLLSALILTLYSGAINAALHDRGNGMIYDDVLDVTWLQDANYAKTSEYDSDGRMNHDAAMAWADQLVFGGYTNWRLPTVKPINTLTYNLITTNDASSDAGYANSAGWLDINNNVASELGHLFYVSLGNLGFCDPANSTECEEQSGWLIRNHSPFININTSYYWTGTAFVDDVNQIFQFGMGNGNQTTSGGGYWYAWAVHDGDIAAIVPIPSSVWLFATAIFGLAGISRRRVIR